MTTVPARPARGDTSGGGPVRAAERITNLDLVRGVATLGILLMNIVSFGLIDAAYFNISADGSEQWHGRLVGWLGEVFVAQKMMGLFSLLFGVGIVVFAERAAAKGRRANWLSLWRNLLLLGIGTVHVAVWDGDILQLYAVCAPVVLFARRFSNRALYASAAAMILGSAVWAALAQWTIDASSVGRDIELGSFWFAGSADIGDTVGLFFLGDFALRALAMMLLGVALYRDGVVQGHQPAGRYRSMMRWGFGLGLPLAVLGVVLHEVNDWGASQALIGQVPNTLATVPMVLGFLGAISLWNQRPDTELHRRLRSVGRMAMTNYLTQTMFGLALWAVWADAGNPGRLALLGSALGVWAIQIAWSKPWLDRFRFGPIEWIWRMATYRRWEPLRRA